MGKSLFEQNGITYHREGDYLIPDLVPPESVPIGVWGQRRRNFFRLVQQIAEREDITEQLKAENQIAWVEKMNSIRVCAMWIVNSEIIYMI
jgi:hypothetical protein